MDPALDQAFKAVFDNRIERLRELLAGGLALDSTGPYGNTLLGNAAQNASPASVELLLSLGADPNQRIFCRSPVSKRVEAAFTPLMYARVAEVAKTLIAAGSDVNARSETGFTPLMRASRDGSCEQVELLLNHGARIDDVDEAGNSALMLAALGGNVDIVETLVRHGANLNFRQRRRSGRKAATALGLAKDACSMFESFPADQLKPEAQDIIEGLRRTIRVLESSGATN